MNILKPEIHRNEPGYGTLQVYLKWLIQNFKKTTKLEQNKFYTFHYDFKEDYPYEQLRFYDILPIVFVFKILPAEKSFISLNLHHLPVQARFEWLQRVRETQKKINEVIPYMDFGNKPAFRLPSFNYPAVWKILKKSKIGIRRYRMEAVHDLREVNLSLIDEALKFWAASYWSSSIRDIEKRYATYKPKT